MMTRNLWQDEHGVIRVVDPTKPWMCSWCDQLSDFARPHSNGLAGQSRHSRGLTRQDYGTELHARP